MNSKAQTALRIELELSNRAELLVPVLRRDPLVRALGQVSRASVLRIALAKGLARLAHDEDDHATYEFLMYYVKEQADAEDETDEWMSKARAYKAMPGLFWHLDKEMSGQQA